MAKTNPKKIVVKAMTIIIHKSTINFQWYFHIKATNGKIIAQSEGYKNKRDCIKSAKSLQGTEYKIEIRK